MDKSKIAESGILFGFRIWIIWISKFEFSTGYKVDFMNVLNASLVFKTLRLPETMTHE
jgi:hypothetical protein